MDFANLLEKLIPTLSMYGLRLLYALVIFVVGRWVAKALCNLIKRIMKKSEVDITLIKFVGSLSYIALMAFVIIAALNVLGIQTASFIAILGAAGLAIGLALQGSLANFAAGVLMIIFKPFKVGDLVEAAGETGVVEEIQIFTTQLLTPDNKTIIIPNGGLMSANITNYTMKGIRRVDMVFGIGYGDDIDKARQVIEEVLTSDDRVLKDPKIQVVVSELADSSVNFTTRPWVNANDYWDVYFSTTEAVKKRFDAEGISIPFPQRDVHMYQQ